jgi:hypothetical protein
VITDNSIASEILRMRACHLSPSPPPERGFSLFQLRDLLVLTSPGLPGYASDTNIPFGVAGSGNDRGLSDSPIPADTTLLDRVSPLARRPRYFGKTRCGPLFNKMCAKLPSVLIFPHASPSNPQRNRNGSFYSRLCNAMFPPFRRSQPVTGSQTGSFTTALWSGWHSLPKTDLSHNLSLRGSTHVPMFRTAAASWDAREATDWRTESKRSFTPPHPTLVPPTRNRASLKELASRLQQPHMRRSLSTRLSPKTPPACDATSWSHGQTGHGWSRAKASCIQTARVPTRGALQTCTGPMTATIPSRARRSS